MNHFYSIRIITFAKKPFTNNFHNPVNQKPLCSIFKNNYIILSINLYFFYSHNISRTNRRQHAIPIHAYAYLFIR